MSAVMCSFFYWLIFIIFAFCFKINVGQFFMLFLEI
jgi:hypothetical protein